MIARILLLFASSALFFSACKGTDDKDDTAPEAQVSVAGITNMSAIRGRSVSTTLDVTSAGTPQAVSLSVEGFPVGVSAALEPSSGTPSFSAVLRLTTANNATPGSYSTASLKATQADGAVKSYPFTVTVTTPPDCARDAAGTYSVLANCSGGGGGGHSSTMTVDPAVPTTRVRIANFGNFGTTNAVIYADLDCAAGTITIPQQSTNHGFTFSGSGTFASEGFLISYTTTYPGGQTIENCTARYSK